MDQNILESINNRGSVKVMVPELKRMVTHIQATGRLISGMVLVIIIAQRTTTLENTKIIYVMAKAQYLTQQMAQCILVSF
jgi:hypothetical protein